MLLENNGFFFGCININVSLRHTDEKVSKQTVIYVCMALAVNINIRGIPDKEYLDEVIEINENSKGKEGER